MPDDDPYEKWEDRLSRKIDEQFDPLLLRRYKGGPHLHECTYCGAEEDCSASCYIKRELDDGPCYGKKIICEDCRPKDRFGLLMRNYP